MEEINNLTKNHTTLHISFFDVKNVLQLKHIYEQNKGNICWMSKEGNKLAHEQISNFWI